ncbi:phosphatase 2C-like domain-containing protein [Gorgonomyces haynaldii]|nr:phosphatase 2C-like domain-containing protein [Gorgonomyces haynaldii]
MSESSVEEQENDYWFPAIRTPIRPWSVCGQRKPTMDRPMEDLVSVHSDHEIDCFVLCDSHGSKEPGQWFIQRIQEQLLDIVQQYRKEPLELKQVLPEVVQQMDQDFCDWRIGQYKSQENVPNDGCTLQIVLLFDGYFVSCHVGDSRTILFDENGPVWQSEDHTTNLSRKLLPILERGGRVCLVHNKQLVDQKGPFQEKRGRIPALENARICRPMLYLTPYPIQWKHMGLGDSMGDVFFKLEPKLFEAHPDVTVLKLEKKTYSILMASDGLFSSMLPKFNTPDKQAMELHRKWQHTWERMQVEFSPMGNDPSLEIFASQLCARDRGQTNLFKRTIRHDDVSVILIKT